MPRFEPFIATRYDLDLVSMNDVAAPPYDVISPTRRAALASQHPNNAVHLDLPVDGFDGTSRYEIARQVLADWQAQGILVTDDRPSFTLYRMEYEDAAGRPRRTHGVIGALALSTREEGELLPHERTTPKDKSDRLDMLRSCQANTSAIWGLSPVPGFTEAAEPSGPPLATWTASDRTRHSVWRCEDPDQVARISAAVSSAPVLIADGHHRYETALAYRAERHAAGDGHGGWDAILAFVVELAPTELTVLPIHRLLSSIPDDFPAALDSHFDVEPIDDLGSPGTLVDRLVARGDLAVATRDGQWYLHPRPDAFAGVRDLDTSRLDAALAAVPEVTVRYQHGVGNVLDAVAQGDAQAAVILRPATVAQIEEIAHGGALMPPKTTFFNPKPSTGAVWRCF